MHIIVISIFWIVVIAAIYYKSISKIYNKIENYKNEIEIYKKQIQIYKELKENYEKQKVITDNLICGQKKLIQQAEDIIQTQKFSIKQHENYLISITKWIAISDRLPDFGKCLVKINNSQIGVAYYDGSEFSPEYSAYNIFVRDDSGLEVTFDGEVTHWLPLTTQI